MTSYLKFTVITFLTVWSALALHAAEPEKKIYAHYMGCYPIGYGPGEYHRQNQWKKMKYDSSDFLTANGGGIVNWPLLPQDRVLTPAQSAELEIHRAIRAGIDGFAVDAWAGGDYAKTVLDHLFAAAERLGAPFDLTICLDPACHPTPPDGDMVNTFADSINWLLAHHGKSAHLARRNGKVLIFGYGSNGILRSPEFSKPPLTIEKAAQIADAYARLRRKIGEPLFIHYDFDNTFLKAPEDVLERVRWAARNFESVGGFLGVNWAQNPAVAKIVREAGSEWSQPLFFQYNNKGGSLLVEPGTDLLRRAFQAARDNGSTLMQFVTWNDYGEDTVLAPGYSTNYTILSLNRHLVDWWKKGSEPAVGKDQLHLIFRRATNGASTYPFQTRRSVDGVLEVATLLTSPGTVSVPAYNLTYEAPAGLSVRQVPLQAGKVSAALSRDGKDVISVTAPEEVTGKPFREDNAMVCFSSNFMDEWRADFGDTPPLLYSEYGDADGDGLPNWFEMYYFGKFPDMTTATGANPGDDPDGDGRSNLEEFQNRTNPLKTGQAYAPGFVWDMAGIQERGVSFSADRDANEREVWFYFYKHGAAGQIAHDGNYTAMPSVWANVPYAGRMAHLSPAKDPQGESYRYLHGWIAHRKTSDGRWQMTMHPRANAAVILGWRSPVDGAVNLSFDVAEVVGADPIILEIHRNAGTTPLHSESIPAGASSRIEIGNVAVKKGDFLYLVADGKPHADSSAAWLENLKIKLETLRE